MKKTLLPIAVAMTVLCGPAMAETSNTKALVSEVCEKCHGPNGTAASSLFPRLAGQNQAYIEAQIKSFRDRSRGDPHARAYMWGIAGPLSDDQITGLAAYYSKLPPSPSAPVQNPQLAAKGKALYENGVPERSIPACFACHGENGEGNDSIPRLAGQHFQYLVRQLVAFHGLLRENEVMDDNAKDLNEDDIAAVSEYLASK